MLRIAGLTAGPIGLNFFLNTHGWPPRLKKSKKIYGQRRALPLVINNYFVLYILDLRPY